MLANEELSSTMILLCFVMKKDQCVQVVIEKSVQFFFFYYFAKRIVNDVVYTSRLQLHKIENFFAS